MASCGPGFHFPIDIIGGIGPVFTDGEIKNWFGGIRNGRAWKVGGRLVHFSKAG